MDSITHTLSGAVTAKVLQIWNFPKEYEQNTRRTLFWLLVISANIPDIDVVFSLFGNRIFSLQHHRGITHSLLFSPFLAFLPAGIFYFLGKLRNFKLLWFSSLLGILIHIFFDLITSFGTQLFTPLTSKRYSLDWMFIVDPIFTVVLVISLLMGKFLKKYQRGIIYGVSIFIILYLSTEFICQKISYERIKEVAHRRNISFTKISSLPQPLSIFRWHGLIQTDDVVYESFFSVFDPIEQIKLTEYPHIKSDFAIRSLEHKYAIWYMKFARHPWIRSKEDSGKQIVEFRDLQFSMDKELIKAFGFSERSTPFVLQYIFSPDFKILDIRFDRRSVIR